MRIFSRIVGVLMSLAWGFTFVICAMSIYRTDADAHGYGLLASHMGYSFDPTKWKLHWIFFNSCIMAFAIVGCFGSWNLLRLQSSGYLLLSTSFLLWLVLVTSIALLHFAPYGYERVGIFGRLELLGISLFFLFLFFVSRRKASATAQAR